LRHGEPRYSTGYFPYAVSSREKGHEASFGVSPRESLGKDGPALRQKRTGGEFRKSSGDRRVSAGKAGKVRCQCVEGVLRKAAIRDAGARVWISLTQT